MIPLLKHLADRFLHDELFIRRWSRAVLGALAGSGYAFADQLAELLGEPDSLKTIKVAAVVAGFLALAITAGEKNPKAEVAPVEEPKP